MNLAILELYKACHGIQALSCGEWWPNKTLFDFLLERGFYFRPRQPVACAYTMHLNFMLPGRYMQAPAGSFFMFVDRQCDLFKHANAQWDTYVFMSRVDSSCARRVDSLVDYCHRSDWICAERVFAHVNRQISYGCLDKCTYTVFYIKSVQEWNFIKLVRIKDTARSHLSVVMSTMMSAASQTEAMEVIIAPSISRSLTLVVPDCKNRGTCLSCMWY